MDAKENLMALERYRYKKEQELQTIFDELQIKANNFISNGLIMEDLLMGDPSAIPLFSCCKCLRQPALTREIYISKKDRAEHNQYRWRYVCTTCHLTPVNHSKSILLAKLEFQ